MNDQSPVVGLDQSTITGANVHAPGLYYLAVTAYDRDPIDSLGRLIWTDGGSFDGAEHAADGAGAASPVAGWIGSGQGGSYHILLSGVCFIGPACGSADFNHDGDSGTDADIEDFFRCIAGNCCATCDSADFNGDGDVATDADIESFFRVLAGQSC